MNFQYCRLCLEPEDPSKLEMNFMQNLCYCQESNFHRKCLTEWIESTGLKNCHHCQCMYDVIYEYPSIISFVLNSKNDLIRVCQKLLRSINIFHLTMIVLYLQFYGQWMPNYYCIKYILAFLLTLRCYFNIKSIYYWYQNFYQNYNEWKHRNFSVSLRN